MYWTISWSHFMFFQLMQHMAHISYVCHPCLPGFWHWQTQHCSPFYAHFITVPKWEHRHQSRAELQDVFNVWQVLWRRNCSKSHWDDRNFNNNADGPPTCSSLKRCSMATPTTMTTKDPRVVMMSMVDMLLHSWKRMMEVDRTTEVKRT